jgi:uncharacterized membrane protein
MSARSAGKLAGSMALIVLAALLIYRGILFVPGAVGWLPWASDTLGHVIKAEYLRQQIATGHIYPDLYPGWYVGVQMLRYYPPLPYYLLVGLTVVIGDSIVAANVFIALCALAGGLAWLLYRRWVGWLPAAAGGVLYLFMPDNVRVAMAEGNLPRVLATALLPFAFYSLLRSLEGARWHRLGLALCFAAIVLSHAMMAAIYAACCALFALLCWVGRVTTIKRALLAIAGAALGVTLSGWWFLPSLTGGITELNQQAMTEALAVFPLTTYLNPLLRAGDPEIVYPGAALLLAAAGLLFIRRGRDGWGTALTLTGLFGVLISTSGFNALFNALPLHHLFWPLRFLGIASFALLLALAWRVRAWGGRQAALGSVMLLGLLGADSALSLPLIHLRPARPDVLAVARQLPALPGWREATLDYSRLGAAPSYLFSAMGGREQVYGWAYQGARTARNVAALNEALRRGYTGYLLDRLALLGVDDVVLLRSVPMDPEFSTSLEAAGFVAIYRGDEVSLYHRDGAPRAYRAPWRALGIGRGAQNLAYLFPQLVVGTRSYVEDYTFEELSAYDTLFFSGFQWHDRRKAEELVQRVAGAGVRVIVDLTGVLDEPLAREPYFLGVWGEHISLGRGPLQLQGEGVSYTLQPFDPEFPSWEAHTPQGMDVEVLHHDYLGAKSAVLGYNTYNGGRVWFVGLNLPYHAALTRDPVAVDLLADLLHLPADQPSDYQPVALVDYVASESGYRFSYALDAGHTLVVPVAHHDGTEVRLNGEPVQARSYENLVAFDAPAGQHEVVIEVRATSIYTVGWVASGLGVAGLVGLVLAGREGTFVTRDENDVQGE